MENTRRRQFGRRWCTPRYSPTSQIAKPLETIIKAPPCPYGPIQTESLPIVAQHKLSDEQALLAKLRYNRLVDIFTGLTTYSLQNHLRTQIEGVQIETDELYVGLGKTGEQYIIPVQAKGGTDRLGRIQLEQDLALCKQRFGHLTCRPVAAQFMDEDVIAMFELTIVKDEVRVVEERHYKLVPAADISTQDLETMRRGLA